MDMKNITLSKARRTKLLMNEFIIGHQNNLTSEDEYFISEVNSMYGNFKKWTFGNWARQYCNHAFISLSYQGKDYM